MWAFTRQGGSKSRCIMGNVVSRTCDVSASAAFVLTFDLFFLFCLYIVYTVYEKIR